MKALRILTFLGALSLFYGCIDSLEVTNLNDPDTGRVLVTPADTEALVAGSYRIFFTRSNWYGLSMTMSVMADEGTCSWGNVGMKDLSSEPRVAYNNTTAYGYAYIVEDQWYGVYSAISSVNDGLKQIDAGMVIGVDGADTDRLRAFGKFVQGISYAHLACVFDQAFIVDEGTDLVGVAAGTVELSLQPYGDVLIAGLGYLADAIAIATAAEDFTITWINGVTLTNADLIELANSYAAYYSSSIARTVAERDALPWATIGAFAAAGVKTDWGPMGDSWNLWYLEAGYYERYWHRADYKTIGITDTSTAYASWLSTPVAERTEMYIYPKDRRITGVTSDPESQGTLFKYAGDSSFPASRGTYHFSKYRSTRYDAYVVDFDTEMINLSRAHMDFIIAEAEYRADNYAAAEALIRPYHEDNGKLPALPTDAATKVDGLTLWEWLKYNKQIETFHTAPGIAFWDDRGWGDLVIGTAIQFPVPAKELEVSELILYTFGGVGEDGGAPKAIKGSRSMRSHY